MWLPSGNWKPWPSWVTKTSLISAEGKHRRAQAMWEVSGVRFSWHRWLRNSWRKLLCWMSQLQQMMNWSGMWKLGKFLTPDRWCHLWSWKEEARYKALGELIDFQGSLFTSLYMERKKQKKPWECEMWKQDNIKRVETLSKGKVLIREAKTHLELYLSKLQQEY